MCLVTVTPLSVCHPNPCYNGGSCDENNSGFVCICPETYKGALCKGERQFVTLNRAAQSVNYITNCKLFFLS